MTDPKEPSNGRVTSSARSIWDVLKTRGFEPTLRRGSQKPDRYEELAGVPAPTEVVELWAVLGGRDILGMCFEGAQSAGQLRAARADEAESSGLGVPYEELDGSSDGAVRMVWWDRRWCPLLATAEHAIAVDCHPGAKGAIGQVIFCDFDCCSDREAVWGSVTDFLRDVLTVISAEELTVEGGHGRIPRTGRSDATVTMAVLEVGRARRDGRPIALQPSC